MNKKDFIVVMLLALLIPAWMFIDRQFIAPKFNTPASIPAEVDPSLDALSESATPSVISALPVVAEREAPTADEETMRISNEQLSLEITSLGGGIRSVTFSDYPAENVADSPPLSFTFSDHAAMSYRDGSGLSSEDQFTLRYVTDKTVEISKALTGDINFVRRLTLTDRYQIEVVDQFINTSSQAFMLPNLQMQTGYISNPAGTDSMQGLHILGVDTYTPAGGIQYWGRKLNKQFKKAGRPAELAITPEEMQREVVDWVSAKNKFFTQVLRTKEPIATFELFAKRDLSQKGIVPTAVAAGLTIPSRVLNANDTFQLDYTYYLGPKNYSMLKEVGHNMEKVMEFETIGFWSFTNWIMEPARKALLHSMNFFNRYLPGGYGVAIILLTILIRILFWPLTHKSTESMKRMQEIQPELKVLQEKYKKDPQRMQQETMKLYKEKKVNPMGGCLPMFIQIPVFIALFTVLRNAIELRFADFLWIADLSTSENLFAGKIPFVGALNILPIVMSVSMIWQQKLTAPATAITPEQQQQQKMMTVMMPILMLFFFYTMPSGLVLYWTVSNLLMIAQTGLRNVRQKAKTA